MNVPEVSIAMLIESTSKFYTCHALNLREKLTKKRIWIMEQQQQLTIKKHLKINLKKKRKKKKKKASFPLLSSLVYAYTEPHPRFCSITNGVHPPGETSVRWQAPIRRRCRTASVSLSGWCLVMPAPIGHTRDTTHRVLC